MYTSLTEFFKDFEYEAEATTKVLKALTPESLSQKVSENGRTLGFLAYHVASSLDEMLGQAGLQLGVFEEKNVPEDPAVLVDSYGQSVTALKVAISEKWTDAMLLEAVNMYGQQWPRGVVLSSLLFHQCHHRGQMTVLMRQAGLKVPGIYGPSFEEWEAYGMKPHP